MKTCPQFGKKDKFKLAKFSMMFEMPVIKNEIIKT